jgi:hypothetical protein
MCRDLRTRCNFYLRREHLLRDSEDAFHVRDLTIEGIYGAASMACGLRSSCEVADAD